MKKTTASGVITAILAVLLSFVLVIVAFTTVLHSSAKGILKSDKLTELFKIAAQEVIQGSEITISDDATATIDEELAKDILESNAAKEIMSAVADELTADILGNAETQGLTAEMLKEIAQNNMPEIIDLIEKHTDETVDPAEMEQTILSVIDENEEDINQALSSVSAVSEEIDEDTLYIVRTVFDKKVSTALIFICVILALLVFVCRYKRFGGFVWLGADTMIVALFTAVVAFGASAAGSFITADAGMSAQESEIILSFIDIIKSNLSSSAIVLFAVSIVLIAAGVGLKMALSRKKTV